MENPKQLIQSLQNTAQELMAYTKKDLQPHFSSTLRTICAALTALATDEELPKNRKLFYGDEAVTCVRDVFHVTQPAYEWMKEAGRFSEPPYEGAKLATVRRYAGWWSKAGHYEVDILVDAWKRETIEAYMTQASEWEREYHDMLKEKRRIRRLENALFDKLFENHNDHTPQTPVRLEHVNKERDVYTIYWEHSNGMKYRWKELSLKQVRRVIKHGAETIGVEPIVERPNLIYVKGKGGDYAVDDWRDVRGIWRVLPPDEDIPEDATTRTEPDPQRYADDYAKDQDEYQTSWRAREAEEVARKAAKEERRRQHEEQRKRAEFRKSIGLQP